MSFYTSPTFFLLAIFGCAVLFLIFVIIRLAIADERNEADNLICNVFGHRKPRAMGERAYLLELCPRCGQTRSV